MVRRVDRRHRTISRVKRSGACQRQNRSQSYVEDRVPTCLSDRPGRTVIASAAKATVRICRVLWACGPRSGPAHSCRKSGRIRAVRSQRLDSFSASIERAPDVLKIDVEGAEMLVLRGANALLTSARAPRVILAEACEDKSRVFGSTPADLVAFIRRANYVAHAIHPRRGLVPWPAAGAVERSSLRSAEFSAATKPPLRSACRS